MGNFLGYDVTYKLGIFERVYISYLIECENDYQIDVSILLS